MELLNDPANPCVGCGPENAFGLRLRFAREGDVVRSRLVVEPRHAGAPERLHSGLLYLAMAETANWTVYGMLDRVGLPVRTGALENKRWVKVGETLTLTGRLGPERTVTVEARGEDEGLVAVLERRFDLPSRAEFAKRMGYEVLPAVYDGLLPDVA